MYTRKFNIKCQFEIRLAYMTSTEFFRICHFEFSKWTYNWKFKMKFQFENRLAYVRISKTTWLALATKFHRLCHFGFSKWTYTWKFKMKFQLENLLAYMTPTEATWHFFVVKNQVILELPTEFCTICHFGFFEWMYTWTQKWKWSVNSKTD